MFKKTQNLKGLTANFVLGLSEQCSRVQIFSALFWKKSNNLQKIND